MKKINYLLSAIVMCGVLFTAGCKGGDEPGITPEQAVLTKLAQTWKLGLVTLDNTSEYADDFANFTMIFTAAKGYATSGSPAFGPFSQASASGTWDFVVTPTDPNASAFQIYRTSDNLVMDVQVSATAMSLSFNFVDDDGDGVHDGREEAVTGAWVFNFTI